MQKKIVKSVKKKDMLRKNVDLHHMLRKLVQLIQAMIYTTMTFILKMGKEKMMIKKKEVKKKKLVKVEMKSLPIAKKKKNKINLKIIIIIIIIV